MACFCNENFTQCLEELKSFFGFKIVSKNISNNDLIDGKFNAIITDTENIPNISLRSILIPKIFIQQNNKQNIIQGGFKRVC